MFDLFNKKSKRINILEIFCAELYQVFGSLIHNFGQSDKSQNLLILDKLSAASNGLEIPEGSILPYNPDGITDVWGFHAILDCRAGKKEHITNGLVIQSFARKLAKNIGLEQPYNDPKIHLTSNGYTFIDLMENGSFICRFDNKTGDFYMDILSLQSFNAKIAIDIIEEFFQPKNISLRYIGRQA